MAAKMHHFDKVCHLIKEFTLIMMMFLTVGINSISSVTAKL